jgi:hypothetical protein
VAVRSALYYNLQLYRGGRKVISVWPSHNRYALAQSWTYKKHRYRLTRGLYTWFVWPGVGPRAGGRYGKLLGKGSFLVVSR